MRTYLAMFLIAFATLAFELTLTRLLSVVSWYYMAYLAISVAMLGMTAGATWVYLNPGVDVERRAAWGSLGFAVAAPLVTVFLCNWSFPLYPGLMSVLAFFAAVTACSVPFFFSGVAVTALLTGSDRPIGRLYAADLLGASTGCVAVLAGLSWTDAPSLMILEGALAAGAALLLARRAGPGDALPRRAALAAGTLLVLGVYNTQTGFGIRPMTVKANFELPGRFLVERWNSYSRVAVERETQLAPQLWGPSPLAPTGPMPQYPMHIDGEAGTMLRPWRTPQDVDHLRYDVVNLAYALPNKAEVAVIGVGGGRDLQAALSMGATRVTGVELNPIFIDLQRGQFRDVAGLGANPAVTFHVDDARAWMASSDQKFDVIQMSLIDTWASTGAGAFSLAENGLYTVEAVKVFMDRLEPGGVFTVSRWHEPGQSVESARLAGLLAAALLESGARSPGDHVVFASSERIVTAIVSRQPLAPGDLAALLAHAEAMQFDVMHAPGRPSVDPQLRGMLASTSLAELSRAAEHPLLNFHPPRDETPYFFNMLKLSGLTSASTLGSGVVRGNLLATATLAVQVVLLALIAVGAVVAPLALRGQPLPRGPSAYGFWAGALYFSCIGAGFMFLEIGMMQRLNLFLGHPTYALGVLLAGLIALTGVGSALTELLPMHRGWRPFAWIGLTLAVIAGTWWATDFVIDAFMTSGLAVRLAWTVALLTPVGLTLGVFFPTGIRLFQQTAGGHTPWYWGLNGIFGVLAASSSTLIAVYLGASVTFALAALAYAGCGVAILLLGRPSGAEGATG